MASFWSHFQQWMLVHILIMYVFVTSGLIINFLQLCACIIWPFSRTINRRINRILLYNIWSQVTFLGQWWSRSDCRVCLYDAADIKYINNEHAITVMNHSYDIEWLMGWIICERIGLLTGTKVYGKSVLKYLPILGWSWALSENIFLERDWAKDKATIANDVKKLAEYPPGMNVWYLLFCEGTRFTEKKHILSNEVARKKGLPELKYHLLPRTKGFALSVREMKGIVPAVYDIEICFCDNGIKPTLSNILNGKRFQAELHMRRFALDDIPSDEEGCSKWLYKMYQEKDELFGYFKEHGKFPGYRLDLKRRPFDLICFCFWTIITCVPLFYYIGGMLLYGSIFVRLTILFGLIFISLVGHLLILMTEADKGSSYGAKGNVDNGAEEDKRKVQ